MAGHVLQIAAVCGLVVITYWNIQAFKSNVLTLPEPDAVTVLEERYKPLRAFLQESSYTKGPITFVTKRDLDPDKTTREGFSLDDFSRWAQGQYIMAPWTLLRNEKAVSDVTMPGVVPPFVIGEFWDGEPEQIPDDLVKVYSGSGLVLFRRKPAP